VFTALSFLSLLLCVATLALWVRSHSRLDGTYFVTQNDFLVSL